MKKLDECMSYTVDRFWQELLVNPEGAGENLDAVLFEFRLAAKALKVGITGLRGVLKASLDPVARERTREALHQIKQIIGGDDD
jgi:hypothetical protein